MKAKDITLGGIMTALITIILYSTSLIPISTLSVLTIASAIIPVVILRSNVKTAIFVYVAASLISFFLVPISISVLYTLFFGIYGIIKYFVERLRNDYLEIILKFLFFNIVFTLGYIILQEVIGINIIMGLSAIVERFIENPPKYIEIAVLWIIAQPIFYVYDYAMTMIISYYLDKFHKIK